MYRYHGKVHEPETEVDRWAAEQDALYNLHVTAEQKADDEARLVEMSEQTGQPVEVVRKMPAWWRTPPTIDDIKQLPPSVTKFIAGDKTNASVSGDDLLGLAKVDEEAQKIRDEEFQKIRIETAHDYTDLTLDTIDDILVDVQDFSQASYKPILDRIQDITGQDITTLIPDAFNIDTKKLATEGFSLGAKIAPLLDKLNITPPKVLNAGLSVADKVLDMDILKGNPMVNKLAKLLPLLEMDTPTDDAIKFITDHAQYIVDQDLKSRLLENRDPEELISDELGESINNIGEAIYKRTGAPVKVKDVLASPEYKKWSRAIVLADRYGIDITPRKVGDDGAWSNTIQKWKQGRDYMMADKLWYEVAIGTAKREDIQLLNDAIDANYLGDTRVKGDNWASEYVWYGAVEMAQPMLKSLALNTAGNVITPAVGTALSMSEWYQQGAGASYKAMIDSGVSHEVASNLSLITAVPYAAAEWAQFSLITRNPLFKKLLVKNGLREAFKKASKAGMVTIARKAGERMLVNLGKETGQEVLQEGVMIFGEETGKFVDNFLNDNNIKYTPLKVIGSRLLETGWRSSLAMGPLGVIGASKTMRKSTHFREYANARYVSLNNKLKANSSLTDLEASDYMWLEKNLNKVNRTLGEQYSRAKVNVAGSALALEAQRKARNAVDFRNGLVKVKEATEQTKTAKRSKTITKTFTQAILKDNGVSDDAYMDAEDVLELMSFVPEIFEELGIDRGMAEQAVEDGAYLGLSLSEANARLKPDEFSMLANITRRTVDSMSAQEGEAFSLQSEVAFAEDILSGEIEQVDFQNQIFDTELGRMREEMKDAKMPQSQIKTNIDLVKETAKTLQERHPEYNASDLVKKIQIDNVKRNGDFKQEQDNLKKWAGKSKLVKDGQPIQLLHGTRAEFEEFRMSKDGAFGGGIYLTESENRAKIFAHTAVGRGEPVVMDVYGKMEKPYHTTLEAYEKKIGRSSKKAFQKKLQKQGYDGIIGEDNGVKSYIIFKPENIKSVYNRGTFSPNTKNIFKQAAQGLLTVKDDKYLISLMSNANASTFAHEFGHVWLEEIKGLVGEQAPKSLNDDWNTIQDWLGVEKQITTEQHEKFARGFEQYLREGNAPSTALEKAFQNFKRWLLNIYKKSQILSAELNDDMRGVFDRMLATENEIAQAKLVNQLVLSSVQEINNLGLVESDRKQLQALLHDGTAKAELALQTARDKAIRRSEVQWKKDAKAQAAEEQVYLLRDDLQLNGGLNLKAMKFLFDKDMIKVIRTKNLRYLKEDGRLPQMVAEENGYDSTDEMIDALVESVTKKERIAQIYDEKRAKSDSRFKADDFLIDTPEFAEVARLKSRALQKKTTAKSDVLTRRAVRVVAERKLRAMSVKEASNVNKFLSAFRRATRAEKKAILNRDFDKALQSNQRAQINYELAKQSKGISNDVQKIKALVKRKVKAKKGTMDDDYRQNIVALANRFHLGKSKVDTNVKPLSKLIMGDGSETMDFGIEWSPWLVSGDYNVDYRGLTVSDMSELKDLINYLDGRGRDIVKELNLKDKLSVAFKVDECIKSNSDIKKIEPVFDSKSIAGKAINFYRGFFAEQKMIHFITRAGDGYSNVGKNGKRGGYETHIWDKLVDMSNENEKLTESVMADIDPHLKQLQDSIGRIDKITRNKKVPLPENLREAGRTRWTGEDVLAIAFNMGNSENIQAVTEGYDLTKADLTNLTSSLNKEDWQAVQDIWDTLSGELYQGVSTTFRKLNHFDMGKVKATPFTVEVDGESIQMKGGYYPLKIDSSVGNDTRISAQEEQDLLLQQFQASFQKAKPRSSFTKERKGFAGNPVQLSLSVLRNHLAFSTLYATHAEGLKEVNRIVNHPDLVANMRQKLGIEHWKMLNSTLLAVAKSKVESLNTIEKFMLKNKILATIYILGANAPVALKQPFSTFGYIQDYSMRAVAQGLLKVAKNPIQAREFMREVSPYMKNRGKNIDTQISESFSGLRGDFKKFSKINKLKHEIAFAPIHLMDFLTVYPLWQGAFTQGIDKFSGDIDKAVKYADEAIESTQPSSRIIDRTHAQRSKGISSFFTAFTSFTAKYANRRWSYFQAFRLGKISLREFASHVLIERIAPQVLMSMMLDILRGDDPLSEENLKDTALDTLIYQIIGIPVVSDILSLGINAASGRGFGGSKVDPIPLKGLNMMINTSNKVMKAFTDSSDKTKTKNAIWAIVHLMSYFGAVPGPRTVDKAERGFEQLKEGEGTIFNILIPEYKK